MSSYGLRYRSRLEIKCEGVPKTIETVEKVVGGSVGGSKQDPNTYQPRPNHYKSRVASLRTGIRKAHEGVFQHAGSFMRHCSTPSEVNESSPIFTRPR